MADPGCPKHNCSLSPLLKLQFRSPPLSANNFQRAPWAGPGQWWLGQVGLPEFPWSKGPDSGKYLQVDMHQVHLKCRHVWDRCSDNCGYFFTSKQTHLSTYAYMQTQTEGTCILLPVCPHTSLSPSAFLAMEPKCEDCTV